MGLFQRPRRRPGLGLTAALLVLLTGAPAGAAECNPFTRVVPVYQRVPLFERTVTVTIARYERWSYSPRQVEYITGYWDTRNQPTQVELKLNYAFQHVNWFVNRASGKTTTVTCNLDRKYWWLKSPTLNGVRDAGIEAFVSSFGKDPAVGVWDSWYNEPTCGLHETLYLNGVRYDFDYHKNPQRPGTWGTQTRDNWVTRLWPSPPGEERRGFRTVNDRNPSTFSETPCGSSRTDPYCVNRSYTTTGPQQTSTPCSANELSTRTCKDVSYSAYVGTTEVTTTICVDPT